jgi:hypothetical protein
MRFILHPQYIPGKVCGGPFQGGIDINVRDGFVLDLCNARLLFALKISGQLIHRKSEIVLVEKQFILANTALFLRQKHGAVDGHFVCARRYCLRLFYEL